MIRPALPLLLLALVCCSFLASGGMAQSSGKVDPFEGYMPAFESGDAVPAPGAFALKLRASADVIYPFSAGRAGDVGYGGVITIEIVRSGRTRIALSGEVSVEAVQDNVFVPMSAQAYDPECPSVRRSLVIATGRSPLTLQIRGASEAIVMIDVGARLECALKNAPI